MSPEELRQAIAGLLPRAAPDVVEAMAGVAEEFALALLGGRHPACGRWMPKARARCGLGLGHKAPCRSVWSENRNKATAKRRQAKAGATA